jgi:Smg protein
MRVMGPHERPRFASEAWGHLIRLNRSGVLGTVELEHVIERALLQIDGRISLNELRSLLSDAGLESSEDTETPPTLH